MLILKIEKERGPVYQFGNTARVQALKGLIEILNLFEGLKPVWLWEFVPRPACPTFFLAGRPRLVSPNFSGAKFV